MTTHRNSEHASSGRPARDLTANPTVSLDQARPPAGLPTPLAVWPCGSLQDCPDAATAGGVPHPGWPPCTGQLPDRLLYRAVGEFSSPGGLVLIGDDPRGVASSAALDFDRHALTRAANPTTRRQLAVTAARHPDLPPDRLRISHDPGTWRLPANHPGADLLLIPSPCPAAAEPRSNSGASRARVPDTHAGHDQHPDDTAALDPAVRWQLQLLAESLPLLRPGALVLVITGSGQRDGRFADRLGQVTGYATGRLQLGYLQHLIGICADLQDGQIHPPRPRTTPGPRNTAYPGAAVHEVVHTDLLLFSTPTDPHPVDAPETDQHTAPRPTSPQPADHRSAGHQPATPLRNGDDDD